MARTKQGSRCYLGGCSICPRRLLAHLTAVVAAENGGGEDCAADALSSEDFDEIKQDALNVASPGTSQSSFMDERPCYISLLPSEVLGRLAAAYLEGKEICPFRRTCKASLEAADAAIHSFGVAATRPESVAALARLPVLKELTIRAPRVVLRVHGGMPPEGRTQRTEEGGGVEEQFYQDRIAAVLGHLIHPQNLRRLRYNCSRLASLEGVENLSALEELDCSGCRGLTSLEPLAGLGQLQRLDLGHCFLGGGGAVALASALQALPGLRELNLECNRLGAEGAAALAPALRAMSRLQQLSLRDNGMGTGGAAALAPALKILTGLRHLDLYCNELEAGVFVTIAPSLGALTGLRHLDLGRNGMGPEGAVALTPVLRSLIGLQQLNLSYNELGDKDIDLLAPSLQTLTGLQCLGLERCRLKEITLVSLLTALPGLQQLILSRVDACDFPSSVFLIE